MGKSKAPKQSAQDEEQLKSDVAAFASSLGFGSAPSIGFNDVDFRKTGSMKRQKPQKQSTQEEKPHGNNSKKDKLSKKPHFDKAQKPKDGDNKPERLSKTSKGGFNKTHMGKMAKPPALSLDNTRGGSGGGGGGGGGGFDKYKNLPKLPLVKASVLGAWYEDAMELEKKVMGEEGVLKGRLELKTGVDAWKSMVEKKRELGERLMWQYAQDYQQSRGQDGDIKMLVTTQRSGTAADKVSAFSVLIGDNPIANLRSLDALLGMVSSKVGKRHALTGFEALKELFISSLLPDRKLRTLLQRPVNDLAETKDGYSLLLFWYWEDCLKQRYERFVFALEEASRDVLPILKDKALKITYALLKSKSEQERRLLSALVNKLGDPQSKGASNADYHLSNLLSDHPNMKAVVIDEVDSFLFRPHLALRAKYHAVNFLSQIRLSNRGDGPKVAKHLIDVYFALFKVLITEASSQKMGKSTKQDGKITSAPSKDGQTKNSSESHVELDSRLLSALLTGVNRAFPYVSSTEADDIIEVQTPVLFKLVHSKNFNVGVQALMLLDKISSKNHVVSDRFYRALYSKLLLPAAMNSSKAEMFIGLILRAMKNDVNLKRVAAFAKRLLQVALQQPPQYACGCLFLLSEVLKARPPLWNMVQQNESVDDELEHFEDIMEENDYVPELASRKEENDLELDKRGGKANAVNDSSEGEDEPLPSGSEDGLSDDAGELHIKDRSKKFQKMQQSSTTNHKEPQASSSVPGGYDPRHREPSFSNADRASWWELVVLAAHAHPSVATMAGTLLSGTNIVYNGNPLNDLSLTAFLDKFMEKKPKQTTWHGGSQIEPAKKLDMSNHLIGPEILSLAEMDVPPEDLVFHKFYMNKMNSSKPKKKKKKKAAEDEAAEELFEVDDDERSSGDDESDNEEIENMLDSSNPSFESDGEYDYDDLDKVANEDDDELVGDISDAEMDISEGEDFGLIANGDQSGDNDDGDDDVDIGDSDLDEQVDHNKFDKKRSKRKSSGKVGESPFASLEDYKHLLNEDEDSPVKENSAKAKKAKSGKSRKKRKSS